MYQVRCDDYPILDFRDDRLILENPVVSLEVNTVGGCSFVIYNNHPYYDKLNRLKSLFEVSDEIGIIFRGRITDDTRDFNNGKAVDLEGAMAFFNDSVVRPFAFPDDFSTNSEYIAATESGNVIEFFLKWLIDNHNAQVQDFQRLKLGNVTVTDPNNYLSRSNSEYASTWETLKSKLFESALGGYLCPRYEEDGTYIDYLAEAELINVQEIEFGANILDLKNEMDGSEVYSAILPLGKTDDETKEQLTISGLPDKDIDSDLVKRGDIIYSRKAVEAHGWICKIVKWEDVTAAKNLQTKAAESLVSGMLFSNTIEVTAVDLHFSDSQIQSFRICRNVRVNSEPHGISDIYLLSRLEIPLLEPQNTKITVGSTKLTMTSATDKKIQDITQSAKNEMKDFVSSSITESAKEQHTAIINDCESIIFSALESYSETGDLGTLRETVESELKLLSDELTLKFTETQTQINNIDGDLQSKFNTITKYFTFDIDGLIIGQINNPYKMILDNDRFSMTVNDIEVMYIANGEVYTPQLTIAERLNLMGYGFSLDDSMNLNCEYVGGE